MSDSRIVFKLKMECEAIRFEDETKEEAIRRLIRFMLDGDETPFETEDFYVPGSWVFHCSDMAPDNEETEWEQYFE